MSKVPIGFFAYPSYPQRISETIHNAIAEINQSGFATIHPWEENKVSGKIVIDEICKQIDKAEFFCADVAGLNPNVMFELGYAIGVGKRLWLVIDNTITSVMEEFRQLRILTSTGYNTYVNATDLTKSFYNEQPFLENEGTIYNKFIKPSIPLQTNPTLLYLKTRHDTDASRRISKDIHSCLIPKTIDDPRETTAQSLTWYGTKIHAAEGIICHLTNADREGSRLHNARYSLISGIAYGMKKPLLMLEEGSLLAPIDYRDILLQYQTANEAAQHLAQWLEPLIERWQQNKAIQTTNKSSTKLVKQLQALQIGEPLAENEAQQIAEDYFVETASYREAMAGTSTIFVGRKGSGKSANLIKIASSIRKQSRSLVCEVIPSDYEYQSIVRLISRYTELDLKGYAIESLWKFLIYTEIANAAAFQLRATPHIPLTNSEERLLNLLDREDGALQKDFSIRLEQSVEKLLSSQVFIADNSTVEHSRLAISETLHGEIINELRGVLSSPA